MMSPAMWDAYWAAKSGTPVYAAARLHNVPCSTLRSRLKSLISSPLGGPTLFGSYDEDLLVTFIKGIEMFEIPFVDWEFLAACRNLAARRGLNGNIDAQWLRRFLRRHSLSVRNRSSKTTGKTSNFTEEKAEAFVATLQNLFSKGYLDDPRVTFVLNESEFLLECDNINVNGSKGKAKIPEKKTKIKNVCKKGDLRKQLTVLPCGNAAGSVLKPFIVYDAQQLLPEWFEGTDDGVVIERNRDGKMDEKLFRTYIDQIVHPYVLTLGLSKAVIFMDSHWRHIYNLELVEFCRQRNIELICFPGGRKSKFQPSKNAFGPLKLKWTIHGKQIEKSGQKITRDNFPSHFWKVWKAFDPLPCLVSSFKNAGIYPFDPEVIRAAVYKPPVTPPNIVEVPDIAGFIQAVKVVHAGLAIQYNLTPEQLAGVNQAMIDYLNSTVPLSPPGDLVDETNGQEILEIARLQKKRKK